MTETATMTITTPSDRELMVTRTFDAPRRLVFQAWTDPKHLPHWLLGPEGWTMPICEIDLRAGGRYRYGWRKGDGSEMEITGTYKEIVPPERIVTTESWGGPWAETLNTIVLTEEGGRTKMTLAILYPSKDARDAATKTGMTQGMSVSIDRLAEYMRTIA